MHSWTNSTNFGSYYIYFLLGKAIFLGYTHITGIVWKMIYSAISPLQYKIKNLDFQKKVFNPLSSKPFKSAFLSSQMLITDYNFWITTINCNDSQHFNPLKSMWKQLFLFCSVIFWVMFLTSVLYWVIQIER